MDIVRTTIKLSKTIRNVARMREIISVFAKNGFAEFMTIGITSNIPNFVLPKSKIKIKEELNKEQERNWQKIIGFRLRKCFEELGPSFIKFGQLLSTREDLFDEGFIQEMQLLRDRAKGIPNNEAWAVVEASLGKKKEQVFKNIVEEPIGTASIGVVYKAQLITGEDVVVKIRRPGIEKIIETDFSILLFLISQIEKVSQEVKYLGISRIVNDFAGSIQNELNFHLEALNCERLKNNLARHDKDNIFYIPKVYKEFTTDNVLVMEFLTGKPFSDQAMIKAHREELTTQINYGIKLFLKTFLQDGFFHADLHGGNFFFQPNGQIGLIDFGLMGTLGKRNRQNFVAIIYALINNNYEYLVYEFLDVAEYDKAPKVDALINDVKNALSPFIGLTVQQTNFSQVLKAVIKTLNHHQIYLPRDWFIVFRAFITLDGVGKEIGIDLDVLKVLESDLDELVKANLNKDELIEEALWSAKDVVFGLRTLPRHLKWFFKDWAAKNYAFDINVAGIDEASKKINSGFKTLSNSILVATFFTAGVYMMGRGPVQTLADIPTITWVFWAIASSFFFRRLLFAKH